MLLGRLITVILSFSGHLLGWNGAILADLQDINAEMSTLAPDSDGGRRMTTGNVTWHRVIHR